VNNNPLKSYIERNTVFILTVILAVTFILKVSSALHLYYRDAGLFVTDDAAEYIRLAKTIVETGTFSISPDYVGAPEIIRTPGYPLFVAAIYAVFGYNNLWVVLTQIFLSTITVFIVFKIAEKLTDIRIALLAALLLALDALSFGYTTIIMTETVFTLVLLLIFYAGIKYIETSGKNIYALAMGFLTAFATQIRPVNYFLFAVLLIFFIVYGLIKRWKAVKIVTSSLLILIPTVVIVGGWQYRNYRLTGYSGFSAIANINMYFFRAAEIMALKEGKTFREIQIQIGYDTYYQSLLENMEKRGEILNEWNAKGLALVKQHPWQLAKMQLKGMISILIRPGGSALTHIWGHNLYVLQSDKSNIEVAESLGTPFKICLLAVFLYLLMLYSGVLSWLISVFKAGKIDSIHLFLSVIVIYFLVISAGPEGVARFRIPIMPLLALISAQGWGRRIAGGRQRVAGGE